ncbi:3-hydroxyacyl-[acyl-carrier-protein] dehydratase FabZ [Leifsonia sp. LS1]|uniref:3-hydroxyacyl-ACP dehydratase FabZ n=1 Tax=Leifsonia sp. LS1 TaxID=2828483 RepID=UPI001CFCB058|nr:3-hydroxyacyl-ACP dehydratase FabZ [Leifsonia sp. LS1]GIT78809.1 3-hydroxyacyl-[acyl-carrier-protein] dehydratase FabZ [Leifsonia sp. LS1]
MSFPSALEAADLMRLLPHRHPFLLLDRVYEIEPGTVGIGVKSISIADPVFAGHFPNEPIYPGVLLIEVAAQLCGIILASGTTEPAFGYLASIKRFKFSALVRPGTQLTVHGRKKIEFESLHEFSVDLKSGAQSVASGTLAIALAKR